MRPVNQKHTVSVLGIDLPIANSHKALADTLTAELQKQMPGIFGVEFVNILSKNIDKFPIQSPSIFRVKLPLVLLDGEPRFNGNVTATEIIDAVKPEQKPVFPPFLSPQRQLRMLPK